MRAVLDANVFISALISEAGPPGDVMRAWLESEFEVIVSPQLLDELSRVLAYPKFRGRVTAQDAAELVELLQDEAMIYPDPPNLPAIRSSDPKDDYLIALAVASNAVIVSGDRQLLALSDVIPVYSPAAFLELIKDR